VPAYHSLLVQMTPGSIGKDMLEQKIFELITEKRSDHEKGETWTIPVNYEGPDLEEVTGRLGLSVEELIRLHTGTIYPVFFIGFLPGFLYLGQTPNELHIPRKAIPRARVQKGSVGLAGSQTGIYPCESPGGWQIIGTTDFEWFNLNSNSPSLINPGDSIQFVAV
ncbi:MAG: 5-oxoprolinase subunit PxpB, partial [Saprospiraceae bacterium]|nr:5-oxoprolinase subunit PxpB [Saprospiraceae bacterium]